MPMPKKKRTKTINPTDEGKQYSIEDFAERRETKIILKEAKPSKIVLKEIKPES
jgi:hypothetical protein